MPGKYRIPGVPQIHDSDVAPLLHLKQLHHPDGWAMGTLGRALD